MALVLADRVKETTTTTGTGTVTLAGAVTGYRSFAAVGNSNQTYYAIIDSTNNAWEVGLGTYTSAGTTLSRTTVFSNSLSTTALINFAAGTKDVICTQPAWSTLNSTNLGFGYQTLNALTTGTNNIAIGTNALPVITANNNNVAVGNSAGLRAANSNGTYVGHFAGATNNGGNSDTTAIGAYAIGLGSFYTGNGLTAVGAYALRQSYTANTTAMGVYAMYNSMNAQNTVAIGHSALYNIGSGWYSTVVGYQAGYNTDSGNYNTFIGYQAALGTAGATPSGANNTVVGALTYTTYTSGSNNTVVGYSAGTKITSGATNTLIGALAGFNVNGSTNTAVGYNAMQGNASMSGVNNTAVGANSMPAVTSGQLSACLGSDTGTALTSAWYSIFIGSSAGKSVTSGDGNICIGYQVVGGAATLTTGTYNTLIGWRAGYGMGNGSQNLAVGHLAGTSLTTGTNNVIIGGYDGASGIISMQGTNNNVVIADNGGGIKLYTTSSGLGGFNVSMAEKGASSGTGSTGTVNFDAATQQIYYISGTATANFTLNIRASATVTLNSAVPIGQVLTLQYWNTNGATAYYMTALTIDGTTVTPKWINGTAPTAGNANSIDVYTFTIYKTGASAYVVTAKQEKFA